MAQSKRKKKLTLSSPSVPKTEVAPEASKATEEKEVAKSSSTPQKEMAKTKVEEPPIKPPKPEPLLPLEERVKVPISDLGIPDEEPPTDPKKIRKAVTAEGAQGLATAVATKTTVKCCGKWLKLVKGKRITATIDQIAYLRSHGLVK